MPIPHIPHILRAALLGACSLLQLQPAAAQMDSGEVPFITSPDNVTLEMLRISNVGPRDHVIDLGSGDGRIVILAAKRFGATGLGVEIVPDLVQQSIRNARDAGVADKAMFRVQDLFATDLKPATVITMYLLPEVNLQLRPHLLQLAPGTRLVSHDWDMGDWQPDQTVVLPVPDKKVGLEKFSRVHLWTVPARVEGLWCGSGGRQLRVVQRYQVFNATLSAGAVSHGLAGRIQGATLDLAAGGQLRLEADGRLQVATARGEALPAQARFQRSADNRCTG